MSSRVQTRRAGWALALILIGAFVDGVAASTVESPSTLPAAAPCAVTLYGDCASTVHPWLPSVPLEWAPKRMAGTPQGETSSTSGVSTSHASASGNGPGLHVVGRHASPRDAVAPERADLESAGRADLPPPLSGR